MKLFEIEEAHSIISNINGLLLLFTATNKTSNIIKEYLENLALDLRDQDLIDEASEQSGESIDLSAQINFIQYLIDTIETKQSSKEIIDKTSN